MPSRTMELTLPFSLADALAICREAATVGRWEIQTISGNRIEGKIPPGMSGAVQGEMWLRFRVTLEPVFAQQTRLVFVGSGFGFGPYVNAKLQRDVTTACNAIQVVSERRLAASAPVGAMGQNNPIANALADLSRLHAQGFLTDEEFQKAKARVIKG